MPLNSFIVCMLHMESIARYVFMQLSDTTPQTLRMQGNKDYFGLMRVK